MSLLMASIDVLRGHLARILLEADEAEARGRGDAARGMRDQADRLVVAINRIRRNARATNGHAA